MTSRNPKAEKANANPTAEIRSLEPIFVEVNDDNNNNNNTNIYRGRPQSLEGAFHEGPLNDAVASRIRILLNINHFPVP